jgi:hypothetical protein
VNHNERDGMPENEHNPRHPLWHMVAGTIVDAVFIASLVSILIMGDYSQGWGSQDALVALPFAVLTGLLIAAQFKGWRAWAEWPETIAAWNRAMASETGVWRGELDEVAFEIRWDGLAGHYWVDGRLADMTLGWEPWLDSLTLSNHVIQAERGGFVPEDTEATRSIRGRLMLDTYQHEEAL